MQSDVSKLKYHNLQLCIANLTKGEIVSNFGMLSGNIHVVACIQDVDVEGTAGFVAGDQECERKQTIPRTISSSVLLLFLPSTTSYFRMKYSSPSPCNLA